MSTAYQTGVLTYSIYTHTHMPIACSHTHELVPMHTHAAYSVSVTHMQAGTYTATLFTPHAD